MSCIEQVNVHSISLNKQGLDVNTPYTNFGCALSTDLAVSNPVSALANPLAISSCLRACADRGLKFAYITNLLLGNSCRCASAVTILSQGLCGLGSNYVYVDASIAPTGVARKRMLEMQKRAKKVGLCPTGLSACRVDQGDLTSDDFEVSSSSSSASASVSASASASFNATYSNCNMIDG
jgi:hypothetical protein